MARRLVSRRSGDEEEILSGWHRRRKGADRRRSDTEDDDGGGEKGFRNVDEKVRACPVAIFGNICRDWRCCWWRCWGLMAVVPLVLLQRCDARGCPKAQDASENARSATDESSRLEAMSPARRELREPIERPKRFMFQCTSRHKWTVERPSTVPEKRFFEFLLAKDFMS